jgi:PAS domain S-box-containing protein
MSCILKDWFLSYEIGKVISKHRSKAKSSKVPEKEFVVAFPDLPDDGKNSHIFGNGEPGSQAAVRLRTALEHSRHPMLIADDQRRWVTGNAAACDLLGIPREEIPWRTMDEFTPPSQRRRLEEQWGAFLASGGAEGWYQLYVPDRGSVPVEFSATANVLPARHLSVFIPSDEASAEQGSALDREPMWAPVAVEGVGRLQLTEREREVMTLVASGLQSGDIADARSSHSCACGGDRVGHWADYLGDIGQAAST